MTASRPTSISPQPLRRPREGPHRARRPRLDRRRARARPRCSSSASSPERTSRRSSAARSSPSAPDSRCSPSRRRASRTSPSSGRSCRRRLDARRARRLALAPGERASRPRGLGLAGAPRGAGRLARSAARAARSTTGRGARSSTRRSSCCSLIAVGGAVGTVMAATSSNPAPASGRTYLVNGHRLYLNCVGSGSPTVVLFNGLGEWTPNWAWVQANVSQTTRVCAFDRAGEGWSGGKAVRAGRSPAGLRPARAPARRACPGAVCPRRALGRRHLRARLRRASTRAQVAGVALIDSATPYQFDLPDYPGVLLDVEARLGAPADQPPAQQWAGSTLRSGFGSLPPQARDAARAFNSSPRQLTAEPDRVPAAADGLQPGESSAQPPRQAARRPERERRRDARLGRRSGQARAALDEQHPPDRRRRHARGAARRQDVRGDRRARDHPGRRDGTVSTPLTVPGT